MKTEKFTEAETNRLLNAYATILDYRGADPSITKELSEEFNRSERSIIAKLVQLKVYVKVPSQGRPLSKAELCQGIAEELGIASLTSLEKANKDELLAVYNEIRSLNYPA